MFGDLWLGDFKGSEYENFKSRRERWAKRKAERLDGEATSSPGILRVEVEQTKDGKDCNLVVWREAIWVSQKQNLPIINSESEQERLFDRIVSMVGSTKENKYLYILFVKHYSSSHIEKALVTVKEMRRDGIIIHNAAALFTDQMHIVAHERKKQWIKPKACQGKLCPKNKSGH